MDARRRVLSLATAAVCGAGFALSPPAWAQDAVTTLNDGELSICLYPGFEPIASQDAAGDWHGWDVVFLRDFAASLDLAFLPTPIEPFDGIWRLPGEDICDIAGSGITITEQRQQDSPGTVWSDTYYVTNRAFVARVEDQGQVQGVADFSGHTVIVTQGSTADLDLRRWIARDNVADVTIDYTHNAEDAARRVLDHEAFAYGSGEVTTNYLATLYPGLVTVWPHPYLQADGSTRRERFSFVVRAADDGLAEALNAYIAEHGEDYGKADD